ncbi:MAG: DeoR/GlpR transcriptional regulator [Spirochaetes bacterium]|nr:MAG: DeoR/GlpR transcriptional regulator [Spirochaetota bacterium]
MRSSAIPAERQVEIARLVKEKGLVTVESLKEVLGVSVITIRRDLAVLEKKGLLERTHGGAVSTSPVNKEYNYHEKYKINSEYKEAVGRRAAAMIEDGDTVFINSGSTTYQVIRFLEGKKNVRVITNNVAAVADFGSFPGIEIILTGGRYRTASNCVVGEFTSQIISQIMASKTVIGADGLSFKGGLTSPIYQEAAVTRQMIERTQGDVVCVADHSKIGRISNFLTVPVDNLDYLVTDWMFVESYRENLESVGIKIIKAEKIE